MLGTDKYAYRSKIKNVDPIEKVMITLGLLLLCIFLNHGVVSLATLVGMTLMNRYYGEHRLKDILAMLKIPMGFIVLGTITVIVGRYSAKESLLLSLPLGNSYYGITTPSLIQGFELAAKSLGIMATVYFLVMNTTISDLTVALEKMHVPTLVIELMELIYRFIFVLLESAEKIRIAQQARLGYRNLRTAYYSTGVLAARVFLDAMRRSEKIYNALESRGYQGQILTLTPRYEQEESLRGAAILMGMSQIIIFIVLRKFL